MKYETQRDLYKALLPVLSIKERINNYYGYSISKEDMWNYLGRNKWKNDINLSLAEIINDIIILDIISMKRKMMYEE